MPLVKAQCTNCGGVLEVDNGKDAAICPYCNTPYIVEQAINKFNVSNASINVSNANINVSGHLDADTMFENWLVTNDNKLKNDFMYYYATDPRKEYFTIVNGTGKVDPAVNVDKAEDIINRCLVGDRFASYRVDALAQVNKLRKSKQQNKIIVPIAVVLIIFAIFLLTVAGLL